MKIWILLLIAGLLLLWSVSRERFEPTTTIKAPPYDDVERKRILGMLSKEDQSNLIEARLKRIPGDRSVIEQSMPGMVSDAVERFFVQVYKTSTTPITQAQIDTYLARPPPISTVEKEIYGRLLKSYYIDQATPAAPTTQAPTTQGPTAGGTTGGSSTTSAAPNAGPVGSSGKGKEIYGPVFTELGTPANGGNPGKDSSKNNKYPELWGGMGDCTSVRTPSGIQGPSQNWLLSQSGSLPSTASLGCDANSQYLPYSRVPGDQDLIPDPYRLARNYSTANYSSKTDPVPFLTDFSAFQK